MCLDCEFIPTAVKIDSEQLRDPYWRPGTEPLTATFDFWRYLRDIAEEDRKRRWEQTFGRPENFKPLTLDMLVAAIKFANEHPPIHMPRESTPHKCVWFHSADAQHNISCCGMHEMFVDGRWQRFKAEDCPRCMT